MGPRSPSSKGGQSPPIFGPCLLLQTAGWMKLVLGMEIGLSPGDFVLDGDPVPFPQKGAEPPYQIFGPFLLWPNGSMHQNATWYGCWPQPRGLYVRWGSNRPSQKGGRAPNFRPMSIAAKRLHGSRCLLVQTLASAQMTLR